MANPTYDANGNFLIDQEYYTTTFIEGLRNNPSGGAGTAKQLLIDMLTKGGRAIAGASGGYSSWTQIYADLQARVMQGDLPQDVLAGLPSPAQVMADRVRWTGVGNDMQPRTEAAVAAQPNPSATPAAPGATPPAPGAGPDPAVAAGEEGQKNIWRQFSQVIQGLGLGSLLTVDSEGKPSGPLWDQIKLGLTTDAELGAWLETTTPWKDMYGGVINGQRDAVARGLGVHIMTPGEVLEYRQRANTLAHQYNLPANFYDDMHDFDAQMIGGIDTVELQQRLGNMWNEVANADPHIRQKFFDYFGPGQGDQWLAAFFLDPARTLTNIDIAARTAVTGGTGARYGLDIQRTLAERIARTGVSDAGLDQGIGSVAQQAGFWRPLIGEGGPDLTDAAVESQFGVGDTRQYQDLVSIENRKRQRLMTTTPTGAGPVETRTGLVGVGPSL